MTDGWGRQRDVFLVILLALMMLPPVLVGGRRFGLLKRFKHLQILLIDLLDLFFASAEIKGSRSTRHWNKHGALPRVLLLLTAHLI